MPGYVWRGDEAASIERLALRTASDGVRADSVIELGGEVIRYSVDLDPLWTFRTLRVQRGAKELLLERDPHCAWRVDGERRDDLAAAVDIDLAFSPFTNTLPIRRLRLPIDTSSDIVTAFVTPELEVRPDPQRYTRLDGLRYRYASRDTDFEREITVDGDGLVVEYPGLFSRS